MPKFYLYNDVKLPKEPERDTASYPHGLILSQTGSQYLLVYDAEPFVSGDGGGISKRGESAYVAYHTLEGMDRWVETSLDIITDANGYAGFPYAHVWSNGNILSREDGVTVMYEASEPVALPDAPAIVGFGWTENAETVMGKTLTVTEGDALTVKLLVSAAVDEGALSVQWYCNGAAGLYEATESAALTSVLEEIQIPESGAATWQCEVTNSLNGYAAQTKTGVATLAVRAKPLPGCAVRLLGLLLGRLFAGQRKGSDLIASGECGDAAVWELDRRGTLTVSGKGAMKDYSISLLNYPPWKQYKGLINKVVIKPGITHVSNYAFDTYPENGEVSTIRIVEFCEGLLSIGESAFRGCALETVKLPTSLTSMGMMAFCNCDVITKLVIPDGVTELPYQVAGDCDSLRRVHIGAAVTSMGVNALSMSCALEELTVSDGNTVFAARDNVLYNKDLLTLGWYPWGLPGVFEVPEGVTKIGNQAFGYHPTLSEITIPASVTEIAYKAFYECAGLTTVNYRGTAEQWAAITNGGGNDSLSNAEIVYEYAG